MKQELLENNSVVADTTIEMDTIDWYLEIMENDALLYRCYGPDDGASFTLSGDFR